VAHLAGIHIGKHARTLAAALLLGGAIVGLSAGLAQAAPKEPVEDNGTRCAIDDDNGHVDFYLPGDRIAGGDGRWIQCQSDGSWDDGGPIEQNRGNQIPRPRGGGVYAP
jgi:hypothetical protein